MTPEERAALENVVKLAVQEGNEPIWEKIRDHDTQIALHKQDMEGSKTSQVAQGTRLGEVERKMDKFQTTARVVWVVLGIVASVIAWLISVAASA